MRARKVMVAAMADSQREQRLGKLRDSVDVWIGTDDPSVVVGAMIETAFLMAAADGELTEIEQEQLIATIEYIGPKSLDRASIRTSIAQLLGALQTDGWETRIAIIAKNLPDPEARRNAYRLAAGVSFIDGEVQESESRLFGLLAEAFEIPEKEASWILTEVRDELFDDDAGA